ncbi:C40 family peptidase [Aquicoccus sp. G2-2]|uniref:C40 family peptidase n=1 Tax=Aquicoccus sp. G2-2 TaxID=3092120 RepID=UPI002AE086C8|nr:NlpC/P60 family protein [Aquicoccus sp. G2-2]MEA1114962.1 NlpC/P60 family protein [Aquicoccus sp. G2-2]
MSDRRQVAVPVADLLHAPDGRRERQVLCGADVTVLERRDGWANVRTAADGYGGYLRETDLRASADVTHWVSARATHAYPVADFKAQELLGLSLGSRVRVIAEGRMFFETDQGFIPRVHLRALTELERDPVSVAERFLRTPYLWGGNSAFGIDCSGLVQAGCRACGIACPGDSGVQAAELGVCLGDEALLRGDLLFWKGHVAWVVDEAVLLHANVHHMAVAYEALDAAVERIGRQGDGPVTARKRLEISR